MALTVDNLIGHACDCGRTTLAQCHDTQILLTQVVTIFLNADPAGDFMALVVLDLVVDGRL